MDLSGQCIYGMENGEILDFGDFTFTRIGGHHTIPNRKERHLVRESIIINGLGESSSIEAPYKPLMYGGYNDFSNFYIETKENPPSSGYVLGGEGCGQNDGGFWKCYF